MLAMIITSPFYRRSRGPDPVKDSPKVIVAVAEPAVLVQITTTLSFCLELQNESVEQDLLGPLVPLALILLTGTPKL